MATAEVRLNFPAQIEESRRKIRDSFKRSHEALLVRENILLSRVDEIENEYNTITQEIQELLEALDKNRSFTENTLTSNRLTDTHQIIHSVIDKKITELTADTYCNIEFEWNNEFEAGIQEIGSIQLNSKSMVSDTCTLPPQVKPAVPDYKSKLNPTQTETGDSSKNLEKKEPETKDESTPQNLFRSSTSPTETREYIESLPIAEKRKLYKCKSYLQLKDIERWPDFKIANKCKSQHSLKNPVTPDDAISDKISLWSGDITKLEIDAIVNAANKSLLGWRGLDGAIHDAAGRSLYNECYRLDGCDTGCAKITCGYRLPARYIIHTVGPMGERREALQSCYESCLRLVEENSIKSIAFCCISTGLYGYPNTNAAVLAIKTVRNWFETSNYAKTQMERVIFCVFLKVDYEIYSDLLCLFFPTSPPITVACGLDKAKKVTTKDTDSSTIVGGDTDGRKEREKTPPVTEESPPSQPQAPTGVPTLTQSVTAPASLTSGDDKPQDDKSRKEPDESTTEETKPLLEDTEESNGAEPKSKIPKLEREGADESTSNVPEPLPTSTEESSAAEPKSEIPRLEREGADESTSNVPEPLPTSTEESSAAEPKSKIPRLEREGADESTSNVPEPLPTGTEESNGAEPKSKIPKLEREGADESMSNVPEPLPTGTEESSGAEPKSKIPKLEREGADESTSNVPESLPTSTEESSGAELKPEMTKSEGEEIAKQTETPSCEKGAEKMEVKSTEDASQEDRGEDN